MELADATATEVAAAIREREVSAVEVLDAQLARIEAHDGALNAFCLVRGDEARAEAAQADAAVAAGEPLGPLHGVPVPVKDNTPTKGTRTTFGSAAFADHVPDEDAVLVERLKAAGAIITGKTTTPEFGNKGVTDGPLLGRTNNPWDPRITAGGSSGGAAAAVAAGFAPLAEGSDGAGSIRIPASICGVVGLKPSFGRVPVYPRNGYESISHHGPLARTVADVALGLAVMAGPDARDPYGTPDGPTDFQAAAARADVAGWPVAFSPDHGLGPVEPEVAAIVRTAAEALTGLGARVEEATPDAADPREPMTVMWQSTFGAIARERVLPVVGRDGMDPHLVELMDAADGIGVVEHYRAAQFFRQAYYVAMGRFFATHRLLVTPTLAVAPFPHPTGQRPGPDSIEGVAVNPFLGWLLTFPANLTGQPAISLPCGFTAAGLPVGLQIVGRPGADADVLCAAAALERALDLGRRRPPLT